MTAAFSPPFPTNPNVGDTFCGWTWNGSMWVCTSAQFVKIQTFLASGPYMPTPGLLGGVAECWGGGGCGGAAQAVAATDMVGGGGGGSGGYSKTGFAAAMVRGGVLVTVGAGGIDTGTPQNGGATSFGAICVANGGFAGAGANGVNVYGWGGPGATAGIGDVAAPGVAGFTGHIQIGPSATDFATAVGGWMALGGTPQPGQCGVGGFLPGPNAAPNTGAGGSGAAVNQLASGFGTTHFGGNGGSGLCVVTEYIFADQGGSWSPSGCGGQARVALDGWHGHGPEGFDD